jgi:hypothetical protein
MSDLLGVGTVFKTVADPVIELMKRVAGPAADEMGALLGDSVRVYRAKRAYELGQKFLNFCNEKRIEPKRIDLKLLLPILECASVEPDEELHDMWATLLTNAADPSHPEVLPSFPDVLSQLTKQEALFFKELCAYTIAGPMNPIGLDELQRAYHTSVTERREDILTFQLFTDDLQRLGLLQETKVVLVPNQTFEVSGGTTLAHSIRAHYVTDYGRRFIAACQR